MPTSGLSRLSQSIQAAITEIHKTGGFLTTNIYFPVWEAGKSKIMVPADLVSDEINDHLFTVISHGEWRQDALWNLF